MNLTKTFGTKLSPYVALSRVDKPTGSFLLYWPCTWGIGMACHSNSLPLDTKVLAIFGAGALIMRGAGCTVNDLWDRNIDGKIERTKNRPLANRAIGMREAVGFLAIQLSAGLCILTQLNNYSIILGAASLIPVAIYPLMKRITYWPQAVLGIAFNWGALLGWAAVEGSVNWTLAAPMYISGIFWTLIYDTIYAHQDIKDDLIVNVKSTAIRFGDATPKWLSAFSIASGSFMGLAGYLNNLSYPFYICTAVGTAHLLYQSNFTDWKDPKDCMKKFCSNQITGGIYFLGILAEWLLI